MKRIIYLILLLVGIFVFCSSVNAKSVARICSYDNAGNPTKQYAVTLKIYDDGTADAVVTKTNGQDSNNDENIQNWSSVKSTYQSKKTCPPIVKIHEDGFWSNVKVWAFYDRAEAAKITDATELNDSNSGGNSSQEDKDKILKIIDEYSNFCNKAASAKYSFGTCFEQNPGLGKYQVCTGQYTKCSDKAKSDMSIYATFVSEVDGYVSKGYLSKTDSKYTSFTKVCAAAYDDAYEFNEASIRLQYEFSKECMGPEAVDGGSSVSKEDVSDNEYYLGRKQSKAPEPVDPDLSGEDVFKICDSNTNPQLVASLRLVGIFVSIIKIIVPIILIIMGSIDMSKAVVSKDHDAIQKNLIVFGKRTLAGVLVFLAPTVMLALFHLIDGMDKFDSAYKTCVDCILGDSSCPDVKFIQGN